MGIKMIKRIALGIAASALAATALIGTNGSITASGTSDHSSSSQSSDSVLAGRVQQRGLSWD